MPVFEATDFDANPEGRALLSAILHPTPAAQSHALRQGRHRAARAAMLADPMALEPHSSSADDILFPVPLTSN